MPATPKQESISEQARLRARLREVERELAKAHTLLERVGSTAMSRAEFLMFGLAAYAELLSEHPVIAANDTLNRSLIAFNGRIGAAMEALGSISYEVSQVLPKKPPKKRPVH